MLIRSLQCCLLLLAVAMVAAGTSNAQTLGTLDLYKANIPFEFAYGDRSFQPGEYKIRLGRVMTGDTAVVVAIEAPDGDLLKAGMGMRNWKTTKDEKSYLIFRSYGANNELYALERISSPNFGYSVRTPKYVTSVKVSKNQMKQTETVALVLTRVE